MDTAVLVIMALWSICILVSFSIRTAGGKEEHYCGWLVISSCCVFVSLWIALFAHYEYLGDADQRKVMFEKQEVKP